MPPAGPGGCSLCNVVVWLILACLADQVFPCTAAKGLASSGKSHAEWALHDVLSSWAPEDGIRPRNLTQIQGKLAVSFNALPSLESGRLGTRAARHLLQEYFITEFGWIITGLEPHMMKRINVIGLHEVPILRAEMPKVADIIHSANLSLHGFSLELLTCYAALIEMLVLRQMNYVLRASYILNGFNMTGTVSKKQVRVLMLACLGLMRTLPATLLDIPEGVPLHQEQQSYFTRMMQTIKNQKHQWNILVNFSKQVSAQSIKEGVVSNKKQYSYDEVKSLYVRLVESFGYMEDISCRDMKRDLRALDPYQTGRVALKDFYSGPADSSYTFGESSKWLNRYGILDTTNRQMPGVMIAGYIEAVCNCVMHHSYVQVCCIPECPVITRQIEAILKAPTASPQELLQIVMNNVTTGNGTLPRKVPPKLVKLLMTIVDAEGRIHIHGRLFAQWLHYLEPYMCAYPVPSKSATILKFQSSGSMSKEDEENVYKKRDYDVHAVYRHMELPAITLWETDEVLPLQEDDIHISRQLTTGESISEQMSAHWGYVVGLVVLLLGMQRWASAFYVMHRKRLEADLLKETDREAESKKGKLAKIRKGDVKRQAAPDAAQDTDAPQEASTLWKPFFTPKPPRPSPKASPAPSPKVPRKASPKPPKAVPSLQSTPQPLSKLPTLAERDADATDTLQEPFSTTLGTEMVSAKRDADATNSLAHANLEDKWTDDTKNRQEIQAAGPAAVKPTSSSLRPPKACPAASPKVPFKASPKPPKAAPSPQPTETMSQCDVDVTDTLQESPFSATLGIVEVSAKKEDGGKNASVDSRQQVKRTDEAEKQREPPQVAEQAVVKPVSSLHPPRPSPKASPAESLKVPQTASPKPPKAECDATAIDTTLQQPISSATGTSAKEKDDDAKLEVRIDRAEKQRQESQGAQNIAVKPASSQKPPQPSPEPSPAPCPKVPHKASLKPHKCDDADAAATVQEPFSATLGTAGAISSKKEDNGKHTSDADAEAANSNGAKAQRVAEPKKVEKTTKKTEGTKKANETMNAEGTAMADEVSTSRECVEHTEEAHRARKHEETKHELDTKTLADAKQTKPTKVAKEAIQVEGGSQKAGGVLKSAGEVGGKAEEELQRASEGRKHAAEEGLMRAGEAKTSTEKSAKAGKTKTIEEARKQTETTQKSDEAITVQGSSEEAMQIEAARKQAAEELRKAEQARELAEAELRKAIDIRKRMEEELRKTAEVRKQEQAKSHMRSKAKRTSQAVELGHTADHRYMQNHERSPRKAEPEASSASQWLNQDLQESSAKWLKGCPDESAEPWLDSANQVHDPPHPPAPSSSPLQAWARMPPGFADTPLAPPPGLVAPPGLEMFGPGSRFQ
eukprot:TRINITY_DN16597_c0_g1_i1.p1 TRINITY_DN16597_c0_g1~~TRINITY_DN16597_c0_g1_i1.p1  ORF type:complete len:1379 (+),score=261.04 TRINITY_DN16597_c0_g1_i1:45-4139(+)